MVKWDYKRAADSARIFDLVTPTLEWYFGGKIYSTEDHDNQFAKLLDFKCAIDAIVDTNEVVFGIAHRVKYSNYRDFTIRVYRADGKLTEFDKLSKAGFKPRYHVQTICINDMPTTIAIAKTADIVYAINQGLYVEKTGRDGARFASLDWDELLENGINVDILKL